MSDEQLPCRNCITLAICINRYRSADKVFVSWMLTDFCCKIREYLTENDRGVILYNEKRRIEFHRFFSGDEDGI